ncbi:hypothetical protein CHL78_001530 [Romboutsia weinsteinii]|uniref:Uncharacterized protein n=1 Tax=Romboutsia weinsteinii TaxID=2020949 RepID=A0A371J9R1_9FIRM|nr:hypothetical protein [Romboutsia weinsteinii]RDY29407.1 hypothetical protein CHL78_001530 [Romboutsia weinsteinii]
MGEILIKKPIKTFLLSVILIISISITACSKPRQDTNQEIDNNETKEVITDVKKEKLTDMLKGKYIFGKTDYEPGEILYFKDDKEIISLYSYHIEISNVKEVISDKDSATYKLETTGSEDSKETTNCTLTISKESEDTISMTWIYDDEDNNGNASDVKILDAKECVESIYKAYPNYNHDKDWNNIGLTDEIFKEVNSSLNENNKQVNSSKENSNKTPNKESNNKDKISESKALEICKSKLKGVLGTDFLILGDGQYGMVKTVTYSGVNYYCIYLQSEECIADYRFCVNTNSGEVFYEDVSAFGKLTPISKYIASLEEDKEASNNESQPISKTEAEDLVKNMLVNNGSYVNSHIEFDYEEGDFYIIHAYDIIDDGDGNTHTATSGWYKVNKLTKEITSEF